MRIMSKWLIKKCWKVQYVSNSVRVDRVSLPKSQHLLDEMEDDDDDDDDDDIYVTSVHDRYAAHPDALDDSRCAG